MKQRSLFAVSAFVLVLILAACGGTGGQPTSGRTTSSVQVTETDFHIDSSVTSFTPGTSYHFIIKNLGKTAHEFMIMPKSEGSMSGMPMGEMDQMALAKVENIAAGATKTLDYTFPTSAADFHSEFACYYPSHYEAGMKQAVSVQA